MTNDDNKIIPIDKLRAERNNQVVPQNYLAQQRMFLEGYNEEMTHEQMKERYAGMYGKLPEKALSKRQMAKIFNEFMQTERRDFLIKNEMVSVQDILDIGIDKFIMTLGWTKPSDVPSWRNNVVRIGICPECNEQFIPLIFQVNQGLCNNCRPDFSVPAIKRFIEHTAAMNERYQEASSDLLMDFYIMFYNDANFRALFRKGSEDAKTIENLEFEIPEWYKKDQERRMKIVEQRALESIEEEVKGNEQTDV